MTTVQIARRLGFYKRHRFSKRNNVRIIEFNPKSLDAAAEFFGLDPTNPHQREMLLHVLADVVFENRKKGRPRWTKAWDTMRLVQLAQAYEEKKRNNPKLSDAKLAKLICDEYPAFKNNDPEQVRQRIRSALRETTEIKRAERRSV